MKVFVIPDLHFPFVDKKSLKEVYKILRKEKPDVVVQLGDIYDQYVFSKYNRDLNLTKPSEEMDKAHKMACQFWSKIHHIVPKAKKVQLLGNHDVRVFKRVAEKLPELSSFLKIREHFYVFPNVKTLQSDRDYIELDDVIYVHGWMTKNGDHMKFFGKSVVHGHSHRPGIVYERKKRGFTFEMDAGHLADEKSTALSYTSSKFSKWLKAIGIVEDGQPRLHILK